MRPEPISQTRSSTSARFLIFRTDSITCKNGGRGVWITRRTLAMDTRAEITFLGTGTSIGVPVIGCDCQVCTSDDPKNKRLRSSIYVKTDETEFVVDTGPDFRQQCLREGIRNLDAALFTHAHSDHVMGFDD